MKETLCKDSLPKFEKRERGPLIDKTNLQGLMGRNDVSRALSKRIDCLEAGYDCNLENLNLVGCENKSQIYPNENPEGSQTIAKNKNSNILDDQVHKYSNLAPINHCRNAIAFVNKDFSKHLDDENSTKISRESLDASQNLLKIQSIKKTDTVGHDNSTQFSEPENKANQIEKNNSAENSCYLSNLENNQSLTDNVYPNKKGPEKTPTNNQSTHLTNSFIQIKRIDKVSLQGQYKLSKDLYHGLNQTNNSQMNLQSPNLHDFNLGTNKDIHIPLNTQSTYSNMIDLGITKPDMFSIGAFRNSSTIIPEKCGKENTTLDIASPLIGNIFLKNDKELTYFDQTESSGPLSHIICLEKENTSTDSSKKHANYNYLVPEINNMNSNDLVCDIIDPIADSNSHYNGLTIQTGLFTDASSCLSLNRFSNTHIDHKDSSFPVSHPEKQKEDVASTLHFDYIQPIVNPNNNECNAIYDKNVIFVQQNDKTPIKNDTEVAKTYHNNHNHTDEAKYAPLSYQIQSNYQKNDPSEFSQRSSTNSGRDYPKMSLEISNKTKYNGLALYMNKNHQPNSKTICSTLSIKESPISNAKNAVQTSQLLSVDLDKKYNDTLNPKNLHFGGKNGPLIRSLNNSQASYKKYESNDIQNNVKNQLDLQNYSIDFQKDLNYRLDDLCHNKVTDQFDRFFNTRLDIKENSMSKNIDPIQRANSINKDHRSSSFDGLNLNKTSSTFFSDRVSKRNTEKILHLRNNNRNILGLQKSEGFGETNFDGIKSDFQNTFDQSHKSLSRDRQSMCFIGNKQTKKHDFYEKSNSRQNNRHEQGFSSSNKSPLNRSNDFNIYDSDKENRRNRCFQSNGEVYSNNDHMENISVKGKLSSKENTNISNNCKTKNVVNYHKPLFCGNILGFQNRKNLSRFSPKNILEKPITSHLSRENQKPTSLIASNTKNGLHSLTINQNLDGLSTYNNTTNHVLVLSPQSSRTQNNDEKIDQTSSIKNRFNICQKYQSQNNIDGISRETSKMNRITSCQNHNNRTDPPIHVPPIQKKNNIAILNSPSGKYIARHSSPDLDKITRNKDVCIQIGNQKNFSLIKEKFTQSADKITLNERKLKSKNTPLNFKLHDTSLLADGPMISHKQKNDIHSQNCGFSVFFQNTKSFDDLRGFFEWPRITVLNNIRTKYSNKPFASMENQKKSFKDNFFDWPKINLIKKSSTTFCCKTLLSEKKSKISPEIHSKTYHNDLSTQCHNTNTPIKNVKKAFDSKNDIYTNQKSDSLLFKNFTDIGSNLEPILNLKISEKEYHENMAQKNDNNKISITLSDKKSVRTDVDNNKDPSSPKNIDGTNLKSGTTEFNFPNRSNSTSSVNDVDYRKQKNQNIENHQIQDILDEIKNLQKIQQEILHEKSSSASIIDFEIEKAKQLLEAKKRAEMIHLKKKVVAILSNKNAQIETIMHQASQNLENYKKGCLDLVKKERESQKKIFIEVQNHYESLIEKYKIIIKKLQDKYRQS